MPKGRRRRPGGNGPDDYRITLGSHRFDPADTPSPPRPKRRRARPVGPADAGHTKPQAPDPADTRLVQVSHPLTGPDVDRLRSEYGLALTAYVPNLTYVERVDAATEARLKNDPAIRAIAPYLPEYKIAPSIHDESLPQQEKLRPGQLLVDAMLFDGGSLDRVVEAVDAAGGHDVRALDDRPIGGHQRVRFVIDDRTVVVQLADLEDIRWLEPVLRVRTDNVAAAGVIQSGNANVRSIWAKGLHGENQIIGIMDEGPIDIEHCFFAQPAPNTAGPTHRKIVDIRDASEGGASGHATFVAGCAAGDDIGSPGGHPARGGAWAARVASASFWDAVISGSLLQELTAATANGVFIHSNSWHRFNGTPSVYDLLCSEVDEFMFLNEDHIFLGASGKPDQLQGPPGTAKNAICVSAADLANPMNLGDGDPGPTSDGRRKPDLVAVGGPLESSLGGTWRTPGVTTRCEIAAGECATSWATAHAAASVALIRQYFTEGWYPTGNKTSANALLPTGALMTAVLVASTVDMTGVGGYPSDEEGWGLIRLDRALFFAGRPRRLVVWDVRHRTGPTTREIRAHAFQVDADTEQLKVVLTWRDPAPAPGSFATPVINNLELRVTTPSGAVTYVGNQLANRVSVPNATMSGDPVNNIHVVVVDAPPAGKWAIEVEALMVARGNPGQGYAIAVTAKLKSACFVAGAVYADPDHPDVEALRVWRDEHLAATGLRRSVVAGLNGAYLVLGPHAARYVSRHPRVRRFLRRRVFPRLAAAVLRRTEAR